MTDIVSVNIAAWLACLAFVVVLVNGALKLTDRMKGQPPNEQLEAHRLQLERRIAQVEAGYVPAKLYETRHAEYQGQLRDLAAQVEHVRSGMHAGCKQSEEAARERSNAIYKKIDEVRVELNASQAEVRNQLEKWTRDTERALGRIEGKIEAINQRLNI